MKTNNTPVRVGSVPILWFAGLVSACGPDAYTAIDADDTTSFSDDGDSGGDDDDPEMPPPGLDLGAPGADGDMPAPDWDTEFGEVCVPTLSVCPPGGACFRSIGGLEARCHQGCDPFDPTCTAGSVCAIHFDFGEPPAPVQFSCMEDPAPQHDPVVGDPCVFANDCGIAQLCASADDLAGSCESEGCCVALCDLRDADALAACPSADEICRPLFESGSNEDHIGRCLPI